MLWYGYKVNEDLDPYSEFMKSLNGYLKIVAYKREETDMDIFYSHGELVVIFFSLFQCVIFILYFTM